MPRVKPTTTWTTQQDTSKYLWSDKIQPWLPTFQPWLWKYPTNWDGRIKPTTNWD